MQQRDVTIDGPDWTSAVMLKRDRAYRQLERDGLDPAFVRAQYDGYEKAHGRLLHDQKLREEAAHCRVVGWFEGEQMVAYASTNVARLLGSETMPILNVVDLCLLTDVTPEQCASLVTALRRLASEASAIAFEVTCIGVDGPIFWSACEAAGARSVSRVYRFLPE